MNISPASLPTTESADAPFRIRRWRQLAWAIWALSMTLFALGFLFAFLARALPGIDNTVGWLVSALIYPTLGALIVWRRPENAVGWLLSAVALGFALLGGSQAYAIYALELPGGAPAAIAAAWFQDWIWWVAVNLLPFVILVFPTGQLPSRRWRPVAWLAAGNMAAFLLADAFASHPLYLFPSLGNPLALRGPLGDVLALLLNGPVNLGLLIIALASITSLLVRFRRAKGIERQQLKWFLMGFVLLVFLLALQSLVNNLGWVSGANPVNPGGIAGWWIEAAGWVSFPTAITIAMLRYRLYDIDALINKALVYGSLTSLLGALYAGLIIGLTSLAGLFAPQATTNPVVLVISTLAIAALFLPARRRIQHLIDRRFYRKKYDAEKTLAAFSATLRNDVDLEQIRARLLAVVNETMQPAHASLWLRSPERPSSEQPPPPESQGQTSDNRPI